MYSKSMHSPQPYPRARRTARQVVDDPARHDPFYYGFRFEHRRGADGREDWVQVPLPASAFLDPQEGDHLMQGEPHWSVVQALMERLRTFFSAVPEVAVFADMKMCWGIPGLSEPCPDVAIVHGIAEPDKVRGTFEPQVEGVLPSLVIEVVSPRFRAGDYDKKPKIYRRAGIEEFLIVDPLRLDEAGRITLIGYQLNPSTNRYRRWRSDAQGWLRSRTTQLAFRPTADPDLKWADRLEVMDLATGARLRRAEEERHARHAAEAELAALKARLELT